MSHSASVPPGSPPPDACREALPACPRRSAVAALGAVSGLGLACLTPVAGTVVMLAAPVLRNWSKRQASGNDSQGGGYLPTIKVDDLPPDGTPIRCTLAADVRDGWTILRNQIIGTVYLSQPSPGKIVAYSDSCPHLGCKVNYEADGKYYLCPCHSAKFAMDGTCVNGISPRNLDELATKLEADGTVWVRYETFRTGTREQVAV